jgi:opacity protein-like surface antigen
VTIAAGLNRASREEADVTVGSIAVPHEAGAVGLAGGVVVSGALGLHVRRDVRIDVEGSLRSNRITGETGFSDFDDTTSRESKYGVMVNAFYDIPFARFTPYVGGGVGAQFVHERGVDLSHEGVSISVPSQTKGSMAWQAIAGTSLALPHARGLSMTADYRYLRLTGTRVYTGTATIPGLGTLPVTDRTTGNRSHSVQVGNRYSFGG